MDILNIPQPTKEKGQRSLSVQDAYFTRFIPSWTFPSGLSPAQWRYWVKSQPVAVSCRDTLISTVQSLDWKITPRDSELRDELKMSVRYHTKLLERGGYWLDLDWTGMLEWILTDLQDLPFGTAVEVGRKGDAPEGRVAWFKPLDGGTLYPTLNKNYPVMQYYASAVQVINFPEHAINRMYLSPRPEIEREGWGIAPPEKVYLAMEMLSRGDKYYANLLLDVPPVGVFDLMDTEWEDAQTWIESFRTFVAGGGADGFKIPVLAGHTSEAKFIPLGQVPNDIMFDRITLKYAALVAAAYGMSLNDIGLQGTSSSGETLAGSIRSERRTRKTGLAKLKKKLKFFFESMLPDTLQFDFIDMDDELATALGRARLANATAWGQLIDKGIFDRKEARLQTIQDGLVTISLPEEPPTKPDEFAQANKPKERPGMLGNPQAPSQGGDGEVKKSAVEFRSIPSSLDSAVESIVSILSPIVQQALVEVGEDETEIMRSNLKDSIFADEEFGQSLNILSRPVGEFSFGRLEKEFEVMLMEEGLYPVGIETRVAELKDSINRNFPAFLSRAIAYIMTSSEYILDDSRLLEDVRATVDKSLSGYVAAFVGMEVQRALEEIREGEMEIPETLRIRSVSSRSPMVSNIQVDAPQISLPPITVNVPERSSNVQVDSPIVNVSPSPIQVDAPVVNVSVPERNVQVNVPEQPAPIINMKSEAPVVNLQLPESNPIVNVEVQPTPIQIDNVVNVEQKPVNKKLTIVKDGNVWQGEAETIPTEPEE